jgi:DNA-binding transcriptional LysR family regulator
MTGLKVIRAVAERGSFTAAAKTLDYTQSAVSRQAAALERAVGTELFERRPEGVGLTRAGLILLSHARAALGELAAAEHELTRAPEPKIDIVRLGLFMTAAATVLPDVATRLANAGQHVRLIARDGSSPALVRAVRAGSLDLAVVTSRPPHRLPDAETPRLRVDVLRDDRLLVAVPALGRFAGRSTVEADELTDEHWIATPSSAAERMLGVWPGLPGRPRVAYSSRDWLVKLRLVAAGHGVTTVAESMRGVLPNGIALLTVTGVPAEIRREAVVRLPGRTKPEIEAVVRELRGLCS